MALFQLCLSGISAHCCYHHSGTHNEVSHNQGTLNRLEPSPLSAAVFSLSLQYWQCQVQWQIWPRTFARKSSFARPKRKEIGQKRCDLLLSVGAKLASTCHRRISFVSRWTFRVQGTGLKTITSTLSCSNGRTHKHVDWRKMGFFFQTCKVVACVELKAEEFNKLGNISCSLNNIRGVPGSLRLLAKSK